MLSFREISTATPFTLDDVPAIIQDVLHPGNFFVGSGCEIELTHQPEREIRWEIFRGRLLRASHTREMATFEEWNLTWSEGDTHSDVPLISIKRDRVSNQIHVVRGLHCYVWEGYDSGANVIESREVKRWIPELVGSITPERFEDRESFRDELISLIFSAVVGASRLPLTSEEAPHPLFTFGKLFYCYRHTHSGEPRRSAQDLLQCTSEAPLSPREKIKRLELLLHVTPQESLSDLINSLREPILPQLESVYNEVSLSPWTDLTDKTLVILDQLQDDSMEEVIDFLSKLIRRIGRHLTAYDLVTFHHRGANYPDALLLDLLLKRYLECIEKAPVHFEAESNSARLRRRALRQGYLLRRFYEGHPVPDAPTSPGEATRVLPESHPRVPEEQIMNPLKRTCSLYEHDPIANYFTERSIRILQASFHDLAVPQEMREMGLALFLDRPLGMGKQPGEPDQTLLLSHLAFSNSIAEKRLRFLQETCPHWPTDSDVSLSTDVNVDGIPLDHLGGDQKPGTVSTLDACQVAGDFLYLKTTSSSIAEFLQQYDYSDLQNQFNVGEPFLILTMRENSVCILDKKFLKRVELKPLLEEDYVRRAGREYLTDGFQVLRVWEEHDSTLKCQECENVFLRPAK